MVFAPRPVVAASAWPDGEGQIITTLMFDRSPVAFDAGGASRAAAWSASRLEASLERGLPDGLTFVADGALRRETRPAQAPLMGFEPATVGLRAPLWSMGAQSLELQASVLAPAAPAPLARLDGSGVGPGAEIRLLYFRSTPAFAASVFFDFEGAVRLLGDGGAWEPRIDATIGVHLNDRLLLLLQNFALADIDRPAALGGFADLDKVQASLVYALDRNLSIQFGGFAATLGRRARDERGLLIALWRRF
jgi:hypothetical protein